MLGMFNCSIAGLTPTASQALANPTRRSVCQRESPNRLVVSGQLNRERHRLFFDRTAVEGRPFVIFVKPHRSAPLGRVKALRLELAVAIGADSLADPAVRTVIVNLCAVVRDFHRDMLAAPLSAQIALLISIVAVGVHT